MSNGEEPAVAPLVVGIRGARSPIALVDAGNGPVEWFDSSLGTLDGGTPAAARFELIATAVAPYRDTCERLAAACRAGEIENWAAFAGAESRAFVRSRDAAATGPAVRRVSLHCSIAGITIAEYRRIFATHLIVTRDHMAAAWRYRQTDVSHRDGPLAWAVDGISEFWFSTTDDLADPYSGDSDAKAAVQADSKLFVDSRTAVTLSGIERDQ
jgi:hypothetical protein